jgi:hypothetical protein
VRIAACLGAMRCRTCGDVGLPVTRHAETNRATIDLLPVTGGFPGRGGLHCDTLRSTSSRDNRKTQSPLLAGDVPAFAPETDWLGATDESFWSEFPTRG